ncbi:S-adenosyl-methyltransferase MraW [Segniliparus rotundus DSM 44985]|uniref:Ribosomal RNA small subunit methyltransferase H n=1 Tax=Segniliparus rotundus (strain ATCC BAA-972 / CDC 1076 / CIP 108378 / DSM 44985 / JCM 13578) TaxID=640132 RepID=D6ZF28_SEGRD|nr:16S rRNA (cytosine(1402)-N(4))-methyltransferase RsmH [Segniliparus rotundus]ADG97552.1 S-adenosyl-methyltransferase MraW [Segniliparus rotundus DSM 44985]
MSAQEPQHVPVLLHRVVQLLAPALSAPNPVLVDATLGLGGHTKALLERFPALRVVGVDRDEKAIEVARARLGALADRVRFVHARFDEVEHALGDEAANGYLLDLGVSSMQLDQAQRGFAYSKEAPLDMRMDSSAELTAAEVLATYEERELARVLRTYGEERFASRIAAAIVRRRSTAPLSSSAELVRLIDDAIPAKAKRTGGHPAKRTFQALRVEVNDELGSLRAALPKALAALAPSGRIVVLAYQSLEDRIVKEAFARATTSRTPIGLPVELPGFAAEFVSLTRGAELASDEEIAQNSRAASVRLRGVERIPHAEVDR